MTEELYRRKIRIQGKPDNLAGHAVQIVDTETGKVIDGAFRTVITLDAGGINQAEIRYYETGDQGGIIIGPDFEPIEHTAIAKDIELELTALERSLMDIGEGGHVCAIPYAKPGASYLSVQIGADRRGIQLTPAQALALLSWLKVSEVDLQKAAMHQNATLAREEC